MASVAVALRGIAIASVATALWGMAMASIAAALWGISTAPAGSARLASNYPQPFADRTIVPFELDRTSSVRLCVFDLNGRRIAVLADAVFAPGRHNVHWQAGELAAGIYVCRLEAGHQIIHRRLVHVP